jgi:predicted outer membrane protein
MVVRILRISAVWAAVVGAAFGGASRAAAADGTRPNSVVTTTDVAPGIPNGGDQEIVSELHLANQLTIALADYGRDRSTNMDVTGLAEGMAADRRAADVALLAYAQVKNMNMDVVGVPGSNLPAHGGLATADIASATPKEFDRVFMARLISDQQGFVAQAEAAGRIARDPALRALVSMTLPSMREQVAIAEALARRLPAVPPAPRVPVPPPAPPP